MKDKGLDRVFDVCVIGGGPSGSMIGLRLAKLGYSVCLIEKEEFPRRHIGESLPYSILNALNLFGVSDVLIKII